MEGGEWEEGGEVGGVVCVWCVCGGLVCVGVCCVCMCVWGSDKNPLLSPSSIPEPYNTSQPCSTVSPRLTELAPLAGGTSSATHFFPLLYGFVCRPDSCLGLIFVWGLILVWG